MSGQDPERMIVTGAVTVQIDSITTPATFEHLSDAVAALWDSASRLSLWLPLYNQMDAQMNGPDSVERIAAVLSRDGIWTSEIFVGDGTPYVVTIQLRGAETDE